GPDRLPGNGVGSQPHLSRADLHHPVVISRNSDGVFAVGVTLTITSSPDQTVGTQIYGSANGSLVEAPKIDPLPRELDEEAIRAIVRDTVERHGHVLDELGDE